MELTARGRDADVYALDESRVLRRYRRGGSTAEEARLMAHLAKRGYPVPQVYEAADVAPTIVIIEGAALSDPASRLVRRLLLRGLRRGCATDPAARTAEAAGARLADPNLTPAEVSRLHRHAAQVASAV